jgi:hypothetical protein
MNATIINAFGRKEGDPLPDAEEETREIDTTSIVLLKTMIGWCEEGKLRNVGLIGISDEGLPLSTVNHHGAGILDICLLNLAADSLKDRIRDIAAGGSYKEHVSVEEGPDDDGGKSA